MNRQALFQPRSAASARSRIESRMADIRRRMAIEPDAFVQARMDMALEILQTELRKLTAPTY
ncbi:hypothetical protein [Thiomonas sp.]